MVNNVCPLVPLYNVEVNPKESASVSNPLKRKCEVEDNEPNKKIKTVDCVINNVRNNKIENIVLVCLACNDKAPKKWLGIKGSMAICKTCYSRLRRIRDKIKDGSYKKENYIKYGLPSHQNDLNIIKKFEGVLLKSFK